MPLAEYLIYSVLPEEPEVVPFPVAPPSPQPPPPQATGFPSTVTAIPYPCPPPIAFASKYVPSLLAPIVVPANTRCGSEPV